MIVSLRVGKAKRAHQSFSKRSLNILQVSTPISFQQAAFDEAMKAAVRPVRDARDISVFHRVEVDVVDVTIEVGVIADSVLPIATLPYAFLSS